MGTYALSLVIDRELTDDEISRVLGRFPDVACASVGGLHTIDSPVSGSGQKTAALVFIGALQMHIGCRVLRVDPELVSIPDIAERTGWDCEPVRQMADGTRGPSGFPAPVGIVGDGIRVWEWAHVFEWGNSNTWGGDGSVVTPVPVGSQVAAQINASLSKPPRSGRETR